jgi:hypothetical protein
MATVVHKDRLIVAGDFTNAGGRTVLRIGQWDGAAWEDVGGGVSDIVYSIAVYNNALVFGGRFTYAGDVSARCVASWDHTWEPLQNPETGILVLLQGSEVSRYSTSGSLLSTTTVLYRLVWIPKGHYKVHVAVPTIASRKGNPLV